MIKHYILGVKRNVALSGYVKRFIWRGDEEAGASPDNGFPKLELGNEDKKPGNTGGTAFPGCAENIAQAGKPVPPGP